MNLFAPAQSLRWYSGPTLVAALDNFAAALAPVELRLPAQDAYLIENLRIIIGLHVGDQTKLEVTLRWLGAHALTAL